MHRLPLTLGAALLLGAASLVPQDAARQDGPRVVAVVDGLDCVYSTSGGNVAVLQTDAGSLVVDTNLRNLSREFVAAVDKAAGEQPRFVVNTHWHGDHTGNNSTWGERKVSIVAHDKVRRRLAGDASLEGRTSSDTPAQALPSVTFEDGLQLFVGGQRVELRHYGAGHTDGDSVVWFPDSRVVHMGDLFFESRFPFIDLGSGGTVRGFVAAVGKVAEELGAREGDWRIIPGHGEVCGLPELRSYHQALQDCVARVERALAAGQGVEQMLEAALLKEYEDWSWGFIKTQDFIQTLATDLAN